MKDKDQAAIKKIVGEVTERILTEEHNLDTAVESAIENTVKIHLEEQDVEDLVATAVGENISELDLDEITETAIKTASQEAIKKLAEK